MEGCRIKWKGERRRKRGTMRIVAIDEGQEAKRETMSYPNESTWRQRHFHCAVLRTKHVDTYNAFEEYSRACASFFALPRSSKVARLRASQV